MSAVDQGGDGPDIQSLINRIRYLESRHPEPYAEVQRLVECLTVANANHEEYERRWHEARDANEELSRTVQDWRSRALASAARVAEIEALLGEARDEIVEAWSYSDYFREKWASDLPTRIDAALNVQAGSDEPGGEG